MSHTSFEERVRPDNIADSNTDNYEISLVLLPAATDSQMIAERRSFLVLPPVFPVTMDRLSEKTALEAPVKSIIS